MKTSIIIAALFAFATQAIDLQILATNQAHIKTLAETQDGPTNGEMSEEEKDTLIQVLCPGVVATSYTQTSGKSSTCNQGSGKKAASKAQLVQESEETGDTELAA